MRHLTKEWYMLSQTYPRPDELKKKLDGIAASCREAQDREALPEKLRQNFMFHDGEVLEVRADTDFVIRLKSPYSDYHKIIFQDAVVKQEMPPVGAWWLYEELYRHKSGVGYEAHVLFYKATGLRHKKILASDLFDTKIICRDILFE